MNSHEKYSEYVNIECNGSKDDLFSTHSYHLLNENDFQKRLYKHCTLKHRRLKDKWPKISTSTGTYLILLIFNINKKSNKTWTKCKAERRLLDIDEYLSQIFYNDIF